jgi:hypothetical protein
MQRRVLALVLAAAALLCAAEANAESLKSLRARDAEEKALSREISYTNSVCGSRMTSRIDWKTASNWPEDASIAGACDNALGALEAVCRSDKGKARASSLSSFVCAGDGSGPSLGGASFRYGASPGVSGFAETKSYLDGAL